MHLQLWDMREMSTEEILKHNVRELQEQLQKAYIRIKELNEELELERNKTR